MAKARTPEELRKQLNRQSGMVGTGNGLGDRLQALEARKGVHVPNAAGATPTKAEFDALLNSLRNAGLLATS